MNSALIFPVLLLAAPLYTAISTSTTAIDPAGNIWQTGLDSFISTTPNAYQKTAISSVCATQQFSPFNMPSSHPLCARLRDRARSSSTRWSPSQAWPRRRCGPVPRQD